MTDTIICVLEMASNGIRHVARALEHVPEEMVTEVFSSLETKPGRWDPMSNSSLYVSGSWAS